MLAFPVAMVAICVVAWLTWIGRAPRPVIMAWIGRRPRGQRRDRLVPAFGSRTW